MSTAIVITIVIAYIIIVSIILLIFRRLKDRSMSETNTAKEEKDEKQQDFLEKAS